MPSPIITSVRLSVDDLLDNCIFLIELEFDVLPRQYSVAARRRNRVTGQDVGSLKCHPVTDPRNPRLLGIQFDDFPCKGGEVAKADVDIMMPNETEIVIVVTDGNGDDTTAVYP